MNGPPVFLQLAPFCRPVSSRSLVTVRQFRPVLTVASFASK